MSIQRLIRLQRCGFFILGISSISVVWLGLEPDSLSQLVLLITAVALFGIPHGAIDPLVARHLGLWQTPAGLLAHLVLYSSLAALTILIWSIIPVASLLIFLLISIWHFSADWRLHVHAIQRWIIGGVIVLGPLLFHGEQVTVIFASLIPPAAAVTIVQWLYPLSIGLLAAVCWPLISQWKLNRSGAIELLALLILAMLLPPLVYFLVFFCGLHSPRHLIDVYAQCRPASIRPWLLTVITISGITIGLAAIGYLTMPAMTVSEQLTRLLFIGLAALTVPHMVLIERFQQQQ